MSVQIFRTACPRDCRDTCTLLVSVDGGRVTAVKGDPDHEVTRGFACHKAVYELRRLYSADRLLHPLIKRNGVWNRAGYDEALSLVSEKLKFYRDEWGSLSIMHYSDKGTIPISRAVF